MRNKLYPVVVTVEDGEVLDVEIFDDKKLAFSRLNHFDPDYGIVRKENGEIDKEKCTYDKSNTMHYSEVYMIYREDD